MKITSLCMFSKEMPGVTVTAHTDCWSRKYRVTFVSKKSTDSTLFVFVGLLNPVGKIAVGTGRSLSGVSGGTHRVKRLCRVQIEENQAELSEHHAVVVALLLVLHRDVVN